MQTLTFCWNSFDDESRAACCSDWQFAVSVTAVGGGHALRYGFRSTTAQRAVSFARWFASIQ